MYFRRGVRSGNFYSTVFGQKDHEGVRQTLRYKLWMAVILTAITIILFLTAGGSLDQHVFKR